MQTDTDEPVETFEQWKRRNGRRSAVPNHLIAALAIPACGVAWSIVALFVNARLARNPDASQAVNLLQLSVYAATAANSLYFLASLVWLAYSGIGDKTARTAAVASLIAFAFCGKVSDFMDEVKPEPSRIDRRAAEESARWR